MHFLEHPRDSRPETFPATASAERLRDLLEGHDRDVTRRGDVLVLAGGPSPVEFHPPRVHRLPDGLEAQEWVDALERVPASLAILLLRAGAASLGYWKGDRLLAHKVFKRYVVRGNGKAQPAYLKSKGKSRAGSRLRLRNARALLTEVNERLHGWWEEHGAPERFFTAAPVRLWAELKRSPPGLPGGDEREVTPVGMNVREPDHHELLRIHHRLTHGRIVVKEAPGQPFRGGEVDPAPFSQ